MLITSQRQITPNVLTAVFRANDLIGERESVTSVRRALKRPGYVFSRWLKPTGAAHLSSASGREVC